CPLAEPGCGRTARTATLDSRSAASSAALCDLPGLVCRPGPGHPDQLPGLRLRRGQARSERASGPAHAGRRPLPHDCELVGGGKVGAVRRFFDGYNVPWDIKFRAQVAELV